MKVDGEVDPFTACKQLLPLLKTQIFRNCSVCWISNTIKFSSTLFIITSVGKNIFFTWARIADMIFKVWVVWKGLFCPRGMRNRVVVACGGGGGGGLNRMCNMRRRRNPVICNMRNPLMFNITGCSNPSTCQSFKLQFVIPILCIVIVQV